MKIGDRVNVVMTSNDIFSLKMQKYCHIISNCTIKYMPTSDGDTYIFITEDGIEFMVNPSCSSFAGIELIAEENSDQINLKNKKRAEDDYSIGDVY